MGEAIFGTLLIVLIVLLGGSALAVLSDIASDWEDRLKDKE